MRHRSANGMLGVVARIWFLGGRSFRRIPGIVAVYGAVGCNFPDDFFRGIALPKVTNRVRPVTFRLRNSRFRMSAALCRCAPMFCRSELRWKAFNLEIGPAVDRFRQCSRR